MSAFGRETRREGVFGIARIRDRVKDAVRGGIMRLEFGGRAVRGGGGDQ